MHAIIRIKLKAIKTGAYNCMDKSNRGTKNKDITIKVTIPTIKLIKNNIRAISKLTNQFLRKIFQAFSIEAIKLRFSKT
jgi:hypothetical protein